MRLLSVNVGRPRDVPWGGGLVSTGIFKAPVDGPVAVRRTNLDGDGQADLSVHGGVDKAVYAYPFEHYAFWSADVGRELVLGQFGENLTTEGLLEDALSIGDVLLVGSARLQVTQPRTPCFKLGIRMGDPLFPERFTDARRPGFYLRVLEDGVVRAGDEARVVDRATASMTVRDVFALRHGEGGTPEAYARAARLPGLSESWRRAFEKRAGQAPPG